MILSVEDVRNPRPLLLISSPTNNHGADLPQAVCVVDAGSAVAGHRLGIDDVLGDGGIATTPLLRPIDCSPAPRIEESLPCAALFHSTHDSGASWTGLILILAELGFGWIVLAKILLTPLS